MVCLPLLVLDSNAASSTFLFLEFSPALAMVHLLDSLHIMLVILSRRTMLCALDASDTLLRTALTLEHTRTDRIQQYTQLLCSSRQDATCFLMLMQLHFWCRVLITLLAHVTTSFVWHGYSKVKHKHKLAWCNRIASATHVSPSCLALVARNCCPALIYCALCCCTGGLSRAGTAFSPAQSLLCTAPCDLHTFNLSQCLKVARQPCQKHGFTVQL